MNRHSIRIGNLLKRIGTGEVIINSISLIDINKFPISHYTPILISEKFLKKLNFYWDLENDQWLENKDGSGFIISRDLEIKDMWVSYQNIKVKYIHEMQNLYFTLYGKDLKLISISTEVI